MEIITGPVCTIEAILTSVIKHYLFKMSSIATHGVHVQELGHLMTEGSVSLSNLLFCRVCVWHQRHSIIRV